MKDPLKTFLERARDGGWDMPDIWKVTLRGLTSPEEEIDEVMAEQHAGENALNLIFNPEAAKAVWGEDDGWRSKEGKWRRKQQWVLMHIQDGDTPLEALEKEL